MTTKLSLVEFGTALLKTGDLDPVYTALSAEPRDSAAEDRLLLAYWCFYHLGFAAYAAEAKTEPEFWRRMETAAANESPVPSRLLAGHVHPGSPGTRWPRGSERRHFRGTAAIESVAYLKARHRTAQNAVEYVTWGGEAVNFSNVRARVLGWPAFGPWMAFKIADMAERVLSYPVDFSDCELGIYKDPRQGAAVAFIQEAPKPRHWEQAYGDGYKHDPWNYPISDDELRETAAANIKLFKKHKAPPFGDRAVNVQEVETIFCKYKSHLKGHYEVGKDTHEIGQGLLGWGDLAEELNQNLNATRDAVVAWRKKNGQ